MELLAAGGGDGDEPRVDQATKMRGGRRRPEPRGGGQVPGGMGLAVHHPQEHGRASRLCNGPPGCGKIVVGRWHPAILGQA